MFTGIIEETGKIQSLRSGARAGELTVSCRTVLGSPGEIPTRIGDSISANGVCLTVTRLTGTTFTADVMPETIRRSALSILGPGSPVNLERAMPAYGRFGGHLVTGHIDGTGTIRSMRQEGNAVWIDLDAPDVLLPGIVEKGSIAIDGISLTVAKTYERPEKRAFAVSIIPHTLSETSLAARKPGDPVNLETDLIGKYVARLMQTGAAEASGFLRPDGRGRESDAPAPDPEKEERLKKLLMNF